MAEIDRNSRVLLGTVRSIVLKVINLSTSMIALADLGAPFVCTLFSMVKLKLLELAVELSGMEDRLNRDSGENGDGGELVSKFLLEFSTKYWFRALNLNGGGLVFLPVLVNFFFLPSLR